MTLSNVPWSGDVKIPTLGTSPAPLPAHRLIMMASKTGQLHLPCAATCSELIGAKHSGLLVWTEVTLTCKVTGVQVKRFKTLDHSLLIPPVCISGLPKSIKTLWEASLKNSTASNSSLCGKKAGNQSLQKSRDSLRPLQREKSGHQSWPASSLQGKG